MTAINAFITEIQNVPTFAAAAASDPKWLAELERIERGLNAVDRQADDDPAIIEIFDKIQATICRADLSLVDRLLEVGRLLTQVRDGERTVN
jgi:hypothetical protein